jgi:hypothetical protein
MEPLPRLVAESFSKLQSAKVASKMDNVERGSMCHRS